MIKAQDLKIGNWVFDGEQCIQVTQITTDKCYSKYGWCLWDEIDLIILTPNILKNAGFLRSGNHPFPDGTIAEAWVNGRFIIQKTNYGWSLSFVNSGDASKLNVVAYNIDYVSELQNWYYLLSGGTELSITL